jgi:transcriptional regulator with XRE-family HTH domain
VRRSKSLIQIGKRIRAIRKARGLSQEQMAMEAGLDRAYYGRVERGEANVAALNLLRIAKALDVDVGQFFPGGSKKP